MLAGRSLLRLDWPHRWRRRYALAASAWAGKHLGWLAFLLLAAAGASAQEVRIVPGGVELEERLGVPSVPGDVVEPLDHAPGKDKPAREFVIAPLPSRNPLLGWTLALPLVWLYQPAFSQPEDSVWTTGGAVFTAEGESVGGGLFHRMSLGGDQWRLAAAGFTADLRYEYFGIGGSPDDGIPLRQDVDFAVVHALYRVAPSLFLGVRASGSQSDTAIDLPPGLPPGTLSEDLDLDIGLVTLGPMLVYDTRDNRFYPRSGWLIEGRADIARTGLGSDVDYESHNWAFNRYETLTEQGTLALRVATRYVSGDVPFFLVPGFGSGSDLRGYQTGTYRDRFLFAAQAEWRERLTDRWGVVAFAGIGTVAPDFAGWDETLPAAGIGLRWVAAPKNELSVRFDVAWGRGDSEFYVSIGEAF
mgnify:FL=1